MAEPEGARCAGMTRGAVAIWNVSRAWSAAKEKKAGCHSGRGFSVDL